MAGTGAEVVAEGLLAVRTGIGKLTPELVIRLLVLIVVAETRLCCSQKRVQKCQ